MTMFDLNEIEVGPVLKRIVDLANLFSREETMCKKEVLGIAKAKTKWGKVFLGCFLVSVTIFFGCDKKSTKPNHPPTTPMITPSATTVESADEVNFSASATDPDGDPLTYTWTACSGFLDTTSGQSVVWTAPTVVIPQTCTVSVEAKDNHGARAGNSANITVNPTPAGVIEGTAFDEKGVAISGMPIGVRLGSSGPWVIAANTDNLGYYSSKIEVGTYYIYASEVLGTRFLSNDHTDHVSVSQGDTATHNLDAKRGYFLELTNIQLKDSGTNVTVTAGESIPLRFGYTLWSRHGCPGCIDWIAVGIEEDGQDAYYVGIPGRYPGESGNANLALTAPNASGGYTVYGIVAPDYTEQDAIARYESNFPDQHRFIPIGTINVQ